MDVLSFLMMGFEVALQPQNLLIALIGAFIGTIVGLLPGLGPLMVWQFYCRLLTLWVYP